MDYNAAAGLDGLLEAADVAGAGFFVEGFEKEIGVLAVFAEGLWEERSNDGELEEKRDRRVIEAVIEAHYCISFSSFSSHLSTSRIFLQHPNPLIPKRIIRLPTRHIAQHGMSPLHLLELHLRLVGEGGGGLVGVEG